MRKLRITEVTKDPENTEKRKNINAEFTEDTEHAEEIFYRKFKYLFKTITDLIF